MTWVVRAGRMPAHGSDGWVNVDQPMSASQVDVLLATIRDAGLCKCQVAEVEWQGEAPPLISTVGVNSDGEWDIGPNIAVPEPCRCQE